MLGSFIFGPQYYYYYYTSTIILKLLLIVYYHYCVRPWFTASSSSCHHSYYYFRIDVSFAVSGQGACGSSGMSDRAVLAVIQHLVELERRSLEEVHLNQQAEWSLNVSSQTTS